MLSRYATNDSGKRVKIANVYTQDEHQIVRNKIDSDALYIIRKLNGAGYEAYLVGGAVRDLLVGKSPKDYDIATSATPRAVRRIFRNSRIIGRRFRLVHVIFKDKIFEVSTFRAKDSGNGNNEFGTIEEDVQRRDFSINALYYSPDKQQVIDYVGGYEDIQNRRVRSLIPLNETFVQDPVRMIRAIKYARKTGFQMTGDLKRAIRKNHKRIAGCPTSRMTEEVVKILQSGAAAPIFRDLDRYGLLVQMLPGLGMRVQGRRNRRLSGAFFESLEKLDGASVPGEEIPRPKGLLAMIRPFLILPELELSYDEIQKNLYYQVKEVIRPMTPPNREVEAAVRLFLREKGIRPKRRRRRRKKKSPS